MTTESDLDAAKHEFSRRHTLAFERRFRAARGDTREPFTVAFGARMIAWLAMPDGKAAFIEAYKEARDEAGSSPYLVCEHTLRFRARDGVRCSACGALVGGEPSTPGVRG
jgi:hypothetical protein